MSRKDIYDFMVSFDDNQKFDLDNIRKLQLGLLKEVKRICTKNNIPYFLVDGTALGAVNLHSFLPWDDDIDVGMYWKDYQKFLKICSDELSSNYVMKDLVTNQDFGCCFGQMIDTSIEIIQENNINSKDVKGVFIDIHPFSNCSRFKLKRFIDFYRFKFYKLCILQRRGYMETGTKKYRLFSILNKLVSERYFINKIIKIRNHKESGLALKIHGRHPEDYIYVNNLKKLDKIRFENEDFYIQPDVKRMLDSIYGDFDLSKQEVNRHKILFPPTI